MFLHGRVELLGQVVRDIGQPWFFLVGSAQAALVLARLFIILLFGILAVSFCGLWRFNFQRQWKNVDILRFKKKKEPEHDVVLLTSVLSLEVLFSSLFRSSSSCSSSLILSSSTLGQKSPSKYGSSLALVSRSSVACLKMSWETEEKVATDGKGAAEKTQ